MKKIIKKIINIFGYKLISNKPSSSELLTMDMALKRLSKRNIEVKTVIDVGASNGIWTEQCIKYFPKAAFFLIEAQIEHKPALIEMQKKINFNYIISAAGNKNGKLYFDNEDLFGGVASEKKLDIEHCIVVESKMLSTVINENKLKGPFLIKLDTHGFEIEILEGCKNYLNQANILIIEAYNFKIAKNSVKFWELCSYLEKKGFYPVDMVDILLRAYDDSLWQMDIVFIKKDRKEFKYNEYQ